KWANICMREKLILPSLREKLPTKNLLHNKFVSLQLAAYLRTQKFKATPELVKNYYDQHILPRLNIRPVQHISVWTVRVYVDEHERPDVVAYHQTFLEEIVQLDQLMSKWLDQDYGFWDSAKLLEQVKKAILIFEQTHPGCVGLFAFDNATSHTAFAKDALVASKMNFSPGGSAPKMRDTIWNNDQADPDNINCCARRLMAHQPDFLAEHGQIQKEIESKGHKIIFYPKFHPEFNYIEMYWGAAKKYTRSHCEYSLSKLKRSIIEAFDSISIERVHSFARLSFRWMDAYRQGLTGKATEYAVKQNKKHRTVNEEIMNWVNDELLN
ncbi:13903_t:CDS:2, partial [Cetraspora pellucida]